jgi:hypothetical protein
MLFIVVSLSSLCIFLVAAELNNLKTMVGDISSAYLEAYTKEKVCFTAGPEFSVLQGHIFAIEVSAPLVLAGINNLLTLCVISSLLHVLLILMSGSKAVKHIMNAYVYMWMTLCIFLLILHNSLTLSRRNITTNLQL